VVFQPPYALYFNGENSYAVISPQPPQLAGAKVGSVMAWVYPMLPYDINGNSTFWDVVGKGWNGDWELMYGWDRIYFDIWYTDNTRTILDLGFHGYTPNTWGFLAVVWDIPSGVIYGYNSWTNQWPSTTVETTKAPRNTVNVVDIGTEGVNWFKGYIYEVLIYDRALTRDEILYNYNHSDNPVKDGLIVWLKADPSTVRGNTWIDLSGYGNNATLYNTQLIQLAPSIPWFWVGVGAVTAVAVGAGLWIAHSKGLI
jgi:hypothetical protein